MGLRVRLRAHGVRVGELEGLVLHERLDHLVRVGVRGRGRGRIRGRCRCTVRVRVRVGWGKGLG